MKEPVELAPSADAGEPLAEHIRRRLERLLGRPLDDVRVHDHAQAERLTRQLGAEAFTLGRHIYVGRGVAAASTRQALGLLAHESTHAVQQTNPTSAAPGGERAGLPLVQRTRAIQRTSEEQEATDVEVAAQRPAARPQPVPIDPDLLTERVYKLLMREARRERERQARA